VRNRCGSHLIGRFAAWLGFSLRIRNTCALAKAASGAGYMLPENDHAPRARSQELTCMQLVATNSVHDAVVELYTSRRLGEPPKSPLRVPSFL